MVEIARRDCNHELASTSTSVHHSDDEQPCESHLAKAKAAYGDLLINIGCICKTLLSLNLESCCTTQMAGSRRTASWQSESRELLDEMRSVSGERAPVRPEGENSCKEKECCSLTGENATVDDKMPEDQLSSLEISGSNPKECATLSSDRCEEEGCCSPGQFEGSARKSRSCESIGVVESPECLDEVTCCGNPDCSAKDDGHQIMQDCYNEIPISGSSSHESVPPCADKCCLSSKVTQATTFKEAAHSSHHANALIRAEGGARNDQDGLRMASVRSATPAYQDGCCNNSTKDRRVLTVVSNHIDVDQDQIVTEHHVISVQGMTCTGCEANLSRTLASISGISNIDTSLILARAEFDLSLDSSASVVDTVKHIERKTGFTCTLLDDIGHQIDLTVVDVAHYISRDDMPEGVLRIDSLDSRTIRVRYFPEVIGARDLIGRPFFASTTLAPVSQPLLIESGRKQLWQMLFKTLFSAALTVPVLVLAWARLPPHAIIYGAVSLVLATIVQVYIAGPWYISAFKALFYSRLVEVDFLVVLSSSAAYTYSIIAYAFLAAGKPLSTESFFETSTLLVTLIILGRLVTTLARQRAVESISLESLQAPDAVVVDEKTGVRQVIDSRLLQFGDIFLVLPVCLDQVARLSVLIYRLGIFNSYRWESPKRYFPGR